MFLLGLLGCYLRHLNKQVGQFLPLEFLKVSPKKEVKFSLKLYTLDKFQVFWEVDYWHKTYKSFMRNFDKCTVHIEIGYTNCTQTGASTINQSTL